MTEGTTSGGRSAAASEETREEGPAEGSTSEAARAIPVALSIPALAISGDLLELGLTAERTLEVPEDAARLGWYAGGGRPGGPGPTVIVGHVDSEAGPAVFFRLRELTPGDTARVESADGRVTTYVVDRTEDFRKDDFPTEDVFGASPEDVLRLITCTGPWETSEESYRDNRVVYASAVEP